MNDLEWRISAFKHGVFSPIVKSPYEERIVQHMQTYEVYGDIIEYCEDSGRSGEGRIMYKIQVEKGVMRFSSNFIKEALRDEVFRN